MKGTFYGCSSFLCSPFKMTSSGFVLMSLLLCFTATSINASDGVLKCWRCSTDVSNGDFCNDPFDPQNISDQLRYWSYVNCTYSVGVRSVNARPVCKKLVQEIYGKRVISRSCFYEDLGDPMDKCARETTSSFMKTLYCQTCNTDGCNAGHPNSRPLAASLLLLLLMLPVALLKRLF